MNLVELKKLQNEQFLILNEVIKICKDYNVDYFMAYGSLLGTIRHHGTIPWDYDIDIFMTRKDFLYFSNYINLLPDNLIVKFMYTNDLNKVSLVRLYKKNTRVYHINHNDNTRIDGIHIDIFILDKARLYPKILNNLALNLSKYLSLGQLDEFERQWLYEHFKNSLLKKLIVKSSNIVSVCFSTSLLQTMIRKILITKSDSRKYMCLLDLRKEAYWDVEWFKNGVQKKYNGILVNVPNNYDSMLKKMYGNYLKLPPEQDRFTSRMNDIVIEFDRK